MKARRRAVSAGDQRHPGADELQGEALGGARLIALGFDGELLTEETCPDIPQACRARTALRDKRSPFVNDEPGAHVSETS